MPLPKPKKNESQDDFLDRCMSDAVMLKEYPDDQQRYAVCQAQWDKSRTAAGDIERRVLAFEAGEIRVADGDQPQLTGYAAKYGIWADICGWFRERIKAGAFDEVLKTSDSRALKNHDPNLLLGRESSGTLRLESNTVGLKFEIDVPDTTTGRDTLEEVRRGDLAGCSFAFTVAEDEWIYREDEPPERTIVRIGQLYDVGPVTYPAYEDTTVVARSIERFRKEQSIASEMKKVIVAAPESEVPGMAIGNPISAAEMARLRRESAIIRNYCRSPES